MLAPPDYLDIGRTIADEVEQSVVHRASRLEIQDGAGTHIELLWARPDKIVRLVVRVSRFGLQLFLMSGEMIIDDDLVANCPVVAQWGISQRRTGAERGSLIVGEAQKPNSARLYLKHAAVANLVQDEALPRIEEAVAAAVETHLNSA